MVGRVLRFAALLGALTGCGPSSGPPNFLLVTMDTTRADHLGCYGYDLASTPAIDGFSEQATLFENALTSVPITLPSHVAMLTGRSPLTSGVRDNGWVNVGDNVVMLAEILAEQSYATGAFVSALSVSHDYCVATGFQTYDDEFDDERCAAETTARAINWLEQQSDRPWFLWVHYFDPHDPHVAPEPFASQTRGSVYDAEISAMDASIADLLGSLDRLGRDKSTHVILIADHGEGLGQHFGYEEHGLLLYEEANRVPFLWRTPGQTEGRRSADLVGGIDIVPTILALLKLEPADELEGISLAPALRGRAIDERAGLYCETLRPYLVYGWSPLYAWRSATAKFIAAPEPELYDLANDAGEVENLYSERRASAEALRGELADYISRWQPEEIARRGSISRDSREVLESLGYLQLIHNRRRVTEGIPGIDDLKRMADPKTHVAFEQDFIHGRLARRHQRWREALQVYSGIQAAVPESPAVKIGMADALRGLGRREEALRLLEAYAADYPGDAYARKMIGYMLCELSRYAEADELFRSLTVAEDDTDLRLARARVAIMLGRFADARAEFVGLQEAFHQRTRADDWLAATETIERFGVARPAEKEADLLAQVGSLTELGLVGEARALLAAVRHTDGNATTLLALEGQVAFASRDWQTACESFRQAIASGDEPDWVRTRLRDAEMRYRSQQRRAQAGELELGRTGVS